MNDSDIKISNSFGNFKYRVNGILIHNNKILVVKMAKNSFYCLPGGHVKMGENSEDALIREMKEETGYEVHINDLITITENFFKRKDESKFHELGFYYSVDLNSNEIINENMKQIEDEDVNLEFKWVNLSEFKEIEFRPIELKEKIIKEDKVFKHIIIK